MDTDTSFDLKELRREIGNAITGNKFFFYFELISSQGLACYERVKVAKFFQNYNIIST